MFKGEIITMFICAGFQFCLYHTRLGEFEQVIYCIWASVVSLKNGVMIPPKMILEGLNKKNAHKALSKTFGS